MCECMYGCDRVIVCVCVYDCVWIVLRPKSHQPFDFLSA